ncbi:MAG: polyprenyl diphosphate synthase [Pseudomonadota bacterium]
MTGTNDALDGARDAALDGSTADEIERRVAKVSSDDMADRAPDQPPRVPAHIAFIMDGNGRWAERRGLKRTDGHLEGMERLREVAKASYEWGVETITVFAFSTENWSRPSYEIAMLMQLFRRYMARMEQEMDTKGVRLRFLGQIDRLPADIQRRAREAEARTAKNDRMTVQIAVSYGARAEIAETARRLAAAAARGEIDPASIDEASFGAALWTADQREPDLVVRTSGERRISNFLLWQAAYAEYAFVDECWPEFTRAVYARVLADYARRERRYGGVVAVPDAPRAASGRR